MSKISNIAELAAALNKVTASTRYNAWEKGNKKRIYIKGAGYNTKKMSTKVWIELGGDRPVLQVRIECPSQPQEWIDSQESEIQGQFENTIRYCRRYFNFESSGKSMEVVVNNAALSAEPVKGYFTEWRNVRVAINRFGKLADRNRQFVVPFEGTKDSAPRGFAELTEKGFAYLKARGEVMLDAYEAVPDWNHKAAQYEQWQADQTLAQQQALADQQKLNDEKTTQKQQAITKIAQGMAAGNDILTSWKLAGCPHPAPAEVVEVKKASGLNWTLFAASIIINEEPPF